MSVEPEFKGKHCTVGQVHTKTDKKYKVNLLPIHCLTSECTPFGLTLDGRYTREEVPKVIATVDEFFDDLAENTSDKMKSVLGMIIELENSFDQGELSSVIEAAKSALGIASNKKELSFRGVPLPDSTHSHFYWTTVNRSNRLYCLKCGTCLPMGSDVCFQLANKDNSFQASYCLDCKPATDSRYMDDCELGADEHNYMVDMEDLDGHLRDMDDGFDPASAD